MSGSFAIQTPLSSLSVLIHKTTPLYVGTRAISSTINVLKLQNPGLRLVNCTATRRRIRYEDEDEDKDYVHNSDIAAMLESHGKQTRKEGLLVRSILDDQEEETMAEDEANFKPISPVFSMNGGDGPYSYTNNSTFQRHITNASKENTDEAIKKLDIKSPSFNKISTFCMADLGCSVGANTLIAMQNIIEAIKLKYSSLSTTHQIPEFQVFFNDQVSNDFNTLFASLPLDRPYFAGGVPGSFHGRLFPKASLHLVYSASAVHFLSKVPDEVLDKESPAWNKGKIYYGSSAKEVVEAYSAQFAKDMETFLLARAQELVPGGLMILIMQGVPNGFSPSQTTPAVLMDSLSSCLMDMVKLGLVSEAKVDSFNVPMYHPEFLEMERLLKGNGCFSIEGMELESLDLMAAGETDLSPERISLHLRAPFEGMIKEHFESDIIDELFNRFTVKLTEDNFFMEEGYKNYITRLSVILKRKNDLTGNASS